MDCYNVLINITQNNYSKIDIDLVNKTLKVGKQVIINKGKVEQHKIKVGDDEYEFDELITERIDVNDLYEQYKYSVPSERDNARRYFKALPASELTDAQLVMGMPRLEARIRLEAYILLSAICETLHLDIEHWFWQGKDKDFIMLKKYI